MITLQSITLALFILLPAMSFGDETISGHYCYTFGDRESLKEAREITQTLAIRNAIESYRIFVESTIKVSNFSLTNDIVQMLSMGFLKNIAIVKHEEQGRTVCDTITAVVAPATIEAFVKREVAKRNKDIEEIGIDKNECFKILSTKLMKGKSMKTGKPCFFVTAVIKAMMNEKDCSPIENRFIFADFINSTGDPEYGDRVLPGRSSGALYKGEIRTVKFNNCCINEDETYRVWLEK